MAHLTYEVLGSRSSSISVTETPIPKVHSIKVTNPTVIKIDAHKISASAIKMRLPKPTATVSCSKCRVSAGRLSVGIIQPRFIIARV